jgi:opacity protein-like surface antigen
MIQLPIVASVTALLSGSSGGASEPAAPEHSGAWNAAAVLEHEDDHAGNGFYFQIGFGLVTTTDSDGPTGEEVDFDEGYAVPAAIGWRVAADDDNAFAFDIEAEAIWDDQDADTTGTLEAVNDLTVLGALVNGVADFALNEKWSLYGGAGIGVAWLDVGTETDALNDFDEEDGPFLAWQAKAGLRWWASHSVSWSLGYRFLNIDDAEVDDDLGGASFDLETAQHVIELGLRIAAG